MSIFRPHKSKPRQFNYIPRYYDPVKEERNQRRKILHGTSSESDQEEYTPGKYVRTQREARDAARESEGSAGISKLRGLIVITVVIALAMLWLLPRIMQFVMDANAEKQGIATAKQKSEAADEVYPIEFIYNESIDVANQEGIETLNDEVLKEIEENEWRYRRITIVPNN